MFSNFCQLIHKLAKLLELDWISASHLVFAVCLQFDVYQTSTEFLAELYKFMLIVQSMCVGCRCFMCLSVCVTKTICIYNHFTTTSNRSIIHWHVAHTIYLSISISLRFISGIRFHSICLFIFFEFTFQSPTFFVIHSIFFLFFSFGFLFH